MYICIGWPVWQDLAPDLLDSRDMLFLWQAVHILPLLDEEEFIYPTTRTQHNIIQCSFLYEINERCLQSSIHSHVCIYVDIYLAPLYHSKAHKQDYLTDKF